MNICMFTNTYLPHVGGVANSVHFFQEDLQALGHNVLVIAPAFSHTNGYDASPESNVLRLPAIQNFNGSDFSVRIPIPFLGHEKIEAFQPDIIHSHHPYLLGDTALRVAKKRRLPLIFTHHTLYEEYTHYVTDQSELLKRFVIHLSTEYANLCDHVVAPSTSVEKLIRHRGVIRPVNDIPTGVDLALYGQGDGTAFRKKFQIPEDALVIGHVGRLAPEKNIGYLGEAVSVFMKNNPSAYFLCVGTGSAGEDLKAHFLNAQQADRLAMPGSQTGQSLVDAYHAMDFFVFSSHSETQGMVLTEAMAAGKPVIALDASGVREVVRDKYNGRLLPESTSPQEFAAAMAYVAENPGAAVSWSNNALETAAGFDRRTCAEKLVRIYHKAIDDFKGYKHILMTESPVLDELVEGIKTEWELASEKMTALLNAVKV